MKGQSISGAYMKESDGVYKHVKSLHLNGKFQTEFKQTSLPGWYDQVTPKQYVKRDEVSIRSIRTVQSTYCVSPKSVRAVTLNSFLGGKLFHLPTRRSLANRSRSEEQALLAIFNKN